jgi:predicted dinucleotide-binding enzyme
MKIGILGSGVVAQTLGSGFLKHGHEVMLGTRDVRKLAEWQRLNGGARTGSVAQAAGFAEVVVLAAKGSAALEVLAAAGADNLAGKVVIDTTNPLADTAPEHGVLGFTTRLDHSLMESLQRAFPDARLVKAFNSVGNLLMVDPQLAGGPPSMFICGNDEDAKRTVRGILDQFGWDTEDMGRIEAARAIEPLCMLWCLPGFLNNDWLHAFKVLRQQAVEQRAS